MLLSWISIVPLLNPMTIRRDRGKQLVRSVLQPDLADETQLVPLICSPSLPWRCSPARAMSQYGGDASAIWAGRPSADDLQRRFDAFEDSICNANALQIRFVFKGGPGQ